MTDHRKEAETCLTSIRPAGTFDGQTAWATRATAHAVLALLDYLQQDDNAQHRITQLEAELQATRNALHRREEVTTAEMNDIHWSAE